MRLIEASQLQEHFPALLDTLKDEGRILVVREGAVVAALLLAGEFFDLVGALLAVREHEGGAGN